MEYAIFWKIAAADIADICIRKGGTMPPNLLKDAKLLADRAQGRHARLQGSASQHHSNSLSRPATSATTVMLVGLSLQSHMLVP